jgi:3-oxoacyl-[acyl-carrier protein] reductase
MIDFKQLNGMTIAITGASRGIGKETAKLLARQGANLILGSRNESDLDDPSYQSVSGKVVTTPLDVTDEQSVDHFTKLSITHFGKIDALINCAGVGVFSSIMESHTEDFDRMVSVNLKGTYLCCKHFANHMVTRNEGKIINIISIAGTTALAGCGGYSASKFGALGFTRVLQTELRGKGVQVTSVLPGAVNSTFWDGIEPKPDLSGMIPIESMAMHIAYLLNLPKDSVIDEIAIMPPLGIL